MKIQTEILISRELIAKRVAEMGKEICEAYEGQPLICVGVLKGSFIFLADLIREIDLPIAVEFIGVSSYKGTASTGHVRITNDLTNEIKDKNVLLIEDIVDTGTTLDYLLDTFKVRQPKSLKIATFLSKPEAHIMHHQLDFVGFEIENKFVIGYGLDLDGRYRELPDLQQVISAP